MPQRNTQKLRTVSNFPDLVDYLRDDLDWPIEVEDAEEIVFEYDPDELGIDLKYAVKINSIRQIRPLAEGQPWGVFYIDFESKKLPVVVLRRILRAFVSSTRSRQAERPVWDMNDLLFISAFGEEVADQREIAFAHFHQEANDLPTLRVLGWDGSDTPLKLEYVDATLQRTMRWPDDPDDHEAWREAWSQTFRHRLGHVIRTANALAVALADLARQIRDAATLLLAHETESGPLRSLHKAFQKALIHDLTEADFADTYAQTITYGLLTAAISRTEMSDGQYGTALIADNVAEMRMTNPFLKEMLQTFLRAGGRRGGIDFDELGIQDVVELLRGDETDLPAILRDFGNKTKGEDPVIHFYEHFLAAYDKKLKVKRGVFYTPKPVVSYIVRRVHELLQTEFGLEDGLADTTTWEEMTRRLPGLTIPEGTDPDSPFVVVLDPATGTATFLVELIEIIHQTMTAKWRRAGLNISQQDVAWNEYVPQHLLPRLYGYELMMAPYAIAHMKMGLKLYETGYRFGSTERVRIYLTNALEPAIAQPALVGILPALAHEAQAVNEIKRHQQFTLVIGNPPYANFGQMNRNPFILGLLDDYKRDLDEKKINIDDDFIKFIRFGEFVLSEAGIGILGLITNSSFLDGITHRQMRQHLLNSFTRLKFLNLHGSTQRGEKPPTGENDENVFDIKQGVAISILVSSSNQSENSTCFGELWGLRADKYRRLLDTRDAIDLSTIINPQPKYFFFVPKEFSRAAEYNKGIPLTEIFSVYQNGIKTDRDSLFFAENRNELAKRFQVFFSDVGIRSPFQENFRVMNSSSYSLLERREANKFTESAIQQCLYRPFDIRWLYYQVGLTSRPAFKVMKHLLKGDNIALLSCRQQADLGFQHTFITKIITECCSVSLKTREITSAFPLWLAHDDNALGLSYRDSNISRNLLAKICTEFYPSYNPDPENIFYYIYAILHSPAYRYLYAAFLQIDFARIPFTSNPDLFRTLSKQGSELAVLHLMEFGLPGEKDISASWPRYHRLANFDGGNRIIERFPSAKNAWSAGRVSINANNGFTGVPEEVWNLNIGGYQVCHKWLKDRKGSTLNDADILHYCKIVTALNETIRIMAEIDEVIEEHGGWPIE